MNSYFHTNNLLRPNGSLILGIDPSINCTGWCLCRHRLNKKLRTWTKEIECIGKIKKPDEIDREEIAKYLRDSMRMLLEEYRPNQVWIEHPPDTVYETRGESSRDSTVARAQSIFKTIAAVYTFAACVEKPVELHFMFPNEWELHYSKRKNMNVKDWSLEEANKLIRISSVKSRDLTLKTKEDENIADAINITFAGIKKLEIGEV